MTSRVWMVVLLAGTACIVDPIAEDDPGREDLGDGEAACFQGARDRELQSHDCDTDRVPGHKIVGELGVGETIRISEWVEDTGDCTMDPFFRTRGDYLKVCVSYECPKGPALDCSTGAHPDGDPLTCCATSDDLRVVPYCEVVDWFNFSTETGTFRLSLTRTGGGEICAPFELNWSY